MMRFVLGVVLLSACDLAYGLEGRDAPADGAALPCFQGTPFPKGSPVDVSELSYSVEGARFSPDMRTAYLSLCAKDQPKTTCDLFVADYDPVANKLSPTVVSYSELNAPNAYDSYPTMTPDSQFLLWASNRGGHLDIYVGAKMNGQFLAANAMKLPAASGMEANEPYVLGDGATLYFSGKDDTTQLWDVFRSSGIAPDFGRRTLVASLNTPFDQAAPVVSDDELEVFYASKASDADTYDIYTAFRVNPNDPFSAVHEVSALSTPAPGVDWPLWLSPDLCTLFYINKESEDANALATLYVTSRR